MLNTFICQPVETFHRMVISLLFILHIFVFLSACTYAVTLVQ